MTHKTDTIETTPREAETIRAARDFAITVRAGLSTYRELHSGVGRAALMDATEEVVRATGKGACIYAVGWVDGMERSALIATCKPGPVWKWADAPCPALDGGASEEAA